MKRDGLALLSNITVESVARRAERLLERSIHIAPGFDTWRTELLTPSSSLWQKEIDIVCLLLHGPALFPDGVNEYFESILSPLLELIIQIREEHRDKTFTVASLDLPRSPTLPLTGIDYAHRAAAFWRNELEKQEIPILDVENLIATLGREHFYSAKAWYFGSLPYSLAGENALAREIVRIENAVHGKRKKCLVLDLDNTLWGGVIGEDGIEGISLARTGLGSQYRDAQRVVKELSAQGVLLAVSSKNNPEDALLPFREHPDIVLHEEDFVAFAANWDPKPANIAAIAQKLNIGIDSLVFIDDNPLEREAVKAALPEVAVPEFPRDSSRLPEFMDEVARTYFTALRIENEDRGKTAMYRAEAQRENKRRSSLSLDGYLASLEMKLDLHRLRPEEAARAAQLTQKTNQFNLTTRRYTEADIASMMENDAFRLWIGTLEDRFGDYGRVVFAIIRIEDTDAFVDTFLMSCRVMGRGVEETALSRIEKLLEAEEIATVRGEYIATPKNAPAQDFWPRMGYLPEGDRWVRHAPFEERKTFICPNC